MDLALIATLVGSLIFLTIAAEFLVRSSSALALGFGVSPLFVGLTIVGFGTSSPEIAASVSATLRGAPEVSVSNLIGSNIVNIGVILGLTSLIYPIKVVFHRVRRDLQMAILVTAMPVVAYFLSGVPERIAGMVAVILMVGYVVYAYRQDIGSSNADTTLAREEVESTLNLEAPSKTSAGFLAIQAMWISGSLLVLILSAGYFVSSATELAQNFGVSERIIGLTIVAGGTSMPELVTSLVAAFRKNVDIAVGNVIGSNIFNVFGILGVCMIVGPQTLTQSTVLVDVPVMFAFSVALLVFTRTEFRITRWEGATLLTSYGIYLGYIIVNGAAANPAG